MQMSKAYFDFPDIDNTDEFSFEKLTTENFQQLYLLFENDDSLFTDERFKKYNTAEQYAVYLDKYGRYSPKHGSQDWIFKWKGEYAGVLHLYDLSLETFAENNKRCWIGFATKPSLRKKGITQKAVCHFVNYIYKNYPEIKYIHAMTMKENVAAGAFLYSAGFEKDEEKRLSTAHNFYLRKKTTAARNGKTPV
jgi:RimJ/RimL family protein N-acetyltransferase